MTVAIFVLSLLFFIGIGLPIAYALILCGTVLMWHLDFFSGQILAQNILNSANSFPLIAIPLFILAGEIMNRGGLSKRIIGLAKTIVGHKKGGLGYVAIFSGLILASLSGSALADAATLTALLLPMMIAAGHDKHRSGGLIASTSVIAPIIPPSIAFIVFGVATGVSITQLFLAGIVPGVLCGISIFCVWWFVSKKENVAISDKSTKYEIFISLKESVWALFMPIIIVVGLRFGIVTPTEAGAVAAVYALFVSCFIYRELNLNDLFDVLFQAAKATSIIMFLVAAASIPAWMITIADIPGQIIDLVSPLINSPVLLMIVLVVLILVIGTAMDLTPTILLLGPVLMPVVSAAGIEPVYFGVMFVVCCSLSLITPPVGTVLNVVSGIGELKYENLVKGTMPFFLAQLLIVALLVAFPEIVLVPLRWFA